MSTHTLVRHSVYKFAGLLHCRASACNRKIFSFGFCLSCYNKARYSAYGRAKLKGEDYAQQREEFHAAVMSYNAHIKEKALSSQEWQLHKQGAKARRYEYHKRFCARPDQIEKKIARDRHRRANLSPEQRARKRALERERYKRETPEQRAKALAATALWKRQHPEYREMERAKYRAKRAPIEAAKREKREQAKILRDQRKQEWAAFKKARSEQRALTRKAKQKELNAQQWARMSPEERKILRQSFIQDRAAQKRRRRQKYIKSVAIQYVRELARRQGLPRRAIDPFYEYVKEIILTRRLLREVKHHVKQSAPGTHQARIDGGHSENGGKHPASPDAR